MRVALAAACMCVCVHPRCDNAVLWLLGPAGPTTHMTDAAWHTLSVVPIGCSICVCGYLRCYDAVLFLLGPANRHTGRQHGSGITQQEDARAHWLLLSTSATMMRPFYCLGLRITIKHDERSSAAKPVRCSHWLQHACGAYPPPLVQCVPLLASTCTTQRDRSGNISHMRTGCSSLAHALLV